MDLTGQTYNYLTVLHRAENTKSGKAQWICRCICGKEIVISAKHLRDKKYPQKSCGCMKRKLISSANSQHRMSHHPAFGVWHSMKQRCTDPNHHAYRNYGGRGINVCDRWLKGFENFWEDMGPTWEKGLDLDRIDNNKGYSPENCWWTSRRQNCRNKRNNRMIETPYWKLPLSVAVELTGIGETTLLYRLDHGCPVELLFVKPDFKNRFMTLKIADRDISLLSGMENDSAL